MPHQTTPFDPTTLNRLWHDLDTAERLASLRQAVPGRLVFTTSFGAEDQVLTHVIAESGLAIELVTLDTGRLFPETYDVWEATERRYGLRIAAFTPEPGAVAGFVGSTGINGFRNSPEARQACCAARKWLRCARRCLVRPGG